MSNRRRDKGKVRRVRGVSASGVRKGLRYSLGWRWAPPRPAISIRQHGGPMAPEGVGP